MTELPPIQLNDPYLKHVMPMSWDDVFDWWRTNEERLPHWIGYWTAKGYDNWEQWRLEKVRHFGLPSLEWHYYQVEMPYISVPAFRGGPFKGWQEHYYKGLHFPKFAEMAQLPKGISDSGEIGKYLVEFPATTVLTGIVHSGDVIVMEGMHRSAALALVAKKGVTLNIQHDMNICLAQWPSGQPLTTAP